MRLSDGKRDILRARNAANSRPMASDAKWLQSLEVRSAIPTATVPETPSRGRRRPMCERSVLVPIPDFLIDDGIREAMNNAHPEYGHNADGVMCFNLDACIAPAVQALWARGIRTIGCCCGHGSGHGVISLETERE